MDTFVLRPQGSVTKFIEVRVYEGGLEYLGTEPPKLGDRYHDRVAHKVSTQGRTSQPCVRMTTCARRRLEDGLCKKKC